MTKKITIIAEIAQAHDGSLGVLHSMIDAAAGAGADAVKFQVHIAEAESSPWEQFRVNFSYADKTRYDYWKRMEFTPEQWAGIKAHCAEKGVEFLASPFSVKAVELLEALGVKRYKIGSGEVENYLMLDRILETGKELILSSGMSSYSELDQAVERVRRRGNPLSILQCTTDYPAAARDIGLNVVTELKQRYKLPVGLSDHSGSIYPPIAAAALGAELVEVHVTFDKSMFGPDAKASLTMGELREMTKGLRMLEEILSNPVDKNDAGRFGALKLNFGKSLAVNRDMKAGEKLSAGDLESKKPAGKGIPAKEYEDILGKELSRDKAKCDFIVNEDINR